VFTMLLAVHACHTNGVIHRDIKPENLLLASDNTLRLCDFGFARQYTPGAKDLTDYVATRWYRSPELLLGTSDYSLASDIYASGCIMAELVDGQPLFPGESEIDQIHVIQRLLGPFTQQQRDTFARNPRFTGYTVTPATALPEGSVERKYGGKLSRLGVQLLKSLLAVDPAARLTVADALRHPYFEGLAPELCPQLVSVLASSPMPKELANDLPAQPAPQRPETRGGDGLAGNGARRRSASRLLPQTTTTHASSFDDGSMPTIGSRPQSRGQAEAPPSGLPPSRNGGLPGATQFSNTVGRTMNVPAVKNGTVAPPAMQSSPIYTGISSGTPGPYASNASANALPMHRTGSGQGRRGNTTSQPVTLPKPSRGDVLDQPSEMGASSSFAGYGLAGQGYSASPAFGAFKPPAVPSHGNLPRLAHGQGLPPSGNGPAPSMPGVAGAGHNPFLGNGRPRQPTGPGNMGRY
jgi:serine/threonine protein kinase